VTVKTFLKVIKVLREESKKWDVPVIQMVAKRGNSPFRILISTVLSSRTQDKVTAEAAKRLFEVADTPEKLLEIPEQTIQKLIYPVGFYRVKAKNLKKLAKILVERHGSTVPTDREELMALPGVGRKTANLIRSVAFGIPDICVDTHVHRIVNRLGFVKTKNPLQTELELKKKLPRDTWIKLNHILVAFGQAICKPVKPLCSVCPVEKYCNKVGIG